MYNIIFSLYKTQIICTIVVLKVLKQESMKVESRKVGK